MDLWSSWFFNSWIDLLRVIVIGICAYAGLILFLRMFGKRTLSKMNAFDLVVTVAIGSILATILLSKEVSLAEGMTAFAVLMILQFAITWSSLHWNFVKRLVKANPRLLFHRGEFLDEGLRQERVTREEVLAAIRAQGIARLDQVAAVILETDGSVTVLPYPDEGAATALASVTGASIDIPEM